MRILVGIAMALVAAPAAGVQYMAVEGVKGESSDARCARGEAINGGLDRDLIRRTPSRPKPQSGAAKARGGVKAAAGDVTGDGPAAQKKWSNITLKRGAAARGCR